MTLSKKKSDSTYSDSIYKVSCMFIAERESEYEKLLNLWIEANAFDGFADVMVHSDAQNCLMAACIAHRMKNDPEKAFLYLKTVCRAMSALDKGVACRSVLPTDTRFETKGNALIPVGKLYLLQICLLLCGDRARLKTLRDYLDIPFVSMHASFHKEPDSNAAEVRILFAAWEGDLATVEFLMPTLEKEYKRFRISDIYTKLWSAVVRRDSDMLDKLLPIAEDAYKKAARRREFDWYGGGKSYNQAMFDFYVTSVLKIAKDVGMHWTYSNENTKQLWPIDAIEFWD